MDTLTYDQARDQIQDGDIIFIADKKGPISTLIEVATKSKFSHVNIAFWAEAVGVKRLLCVEAQGGTRRRILNLSYYEDYKGASLYVVTPPKAWTDVAPVALALLGKKKYNYLEALYVGLRDFLKDYFKIRIPEKAFSGEICSEFVSRIYQLQDMYISPEDLYEELMKTQQLRFIIAP